MVFDVVCLYIEDIDVDTISKIVDLTIDEIKENDTGD